MERQNKYPHVFKFLIASYCYSHCWCRHFHLGLPFLGMMRCEQSRDEGKAIGSGWTAKRLAHEARAMASFLLNQILGTGCPQYLADLCLESPRWLGKNIAVPVQIRPHDALKTYYLPLCMQRTICYLNATYNISKSYMTWWLSTTQVWES